MPLTYEITLIGEIRSTETLLQIAQAACGSDSDAEALASFKEMLVRNGGRIVIDDVSRRGNPFVKLKAACIEDGIGWKETVADFDLEEPDTMNTWMPGFDKEKSVTLVRGKMPSLTLSQLESAKCAGTDALVKMVADLRAHSLIDVDMRLTASDELFAAAAFVPAEVEDDAPLFAFGR